MRLALLQTELYWEDIAGNLASLEEKIWKIDKTVDVIVLPEMFSTGFSMQPEKLAEPMNFTTHKWMKQMAKQTQAAVCGSFMAKENSHFYNRLLWVLPDGTHYVYDKRHLFSYGNEHEHFSPGTKQLVVEWKGWRFCPLICYDLRFPVWSRNTSENKYDCLIYVANWPQRRAMAWNTLLKARAIENVCYSIGVNRVGSDGNGIYHQGDSSAYDFLGNQIVSVTDKEETLFVDLDKQQLDDFRAHFPALNDGDRFSIMSDEL